MASLWSVGTVVLDAVKSIWNTINPIFYLVMIGASIFVLRQHYKPNNNTTQTPHSDEIVKELSTQRRMLEALAEQVRSLTTTMQTLADSQKAQLKILKPLGQGIVQLGKPILEMGKNHGELLKQFRINTAGMLTLGDAVYRIQNAVCEDDGKSSRKALKPPPSAKPT